MSSLKYRAGGANRFLRIDDRGVVEDCIIPASSVGPSAPAPLALSVDPSTPSDGVTHFVGIQEAIDSLGGRLLQNTVITIAAGTYAENVVVPQGLGVGSGFQLQLMGDSRDISGCGINAGSGWNTGVGAAPIGGCPGLDGQAAFAGLAGGNTLTVTGVLGANDPDFVGCGVTTSDLVEIRHTDGTFATYSITNVAATVLTLSPNLSANVNGLGAAMCIRPRVIVAPASGEPFQNGGLCYLQGIAFLAPAGQRASRIFPLSSTLMDNVFMKSDVCAMDVATLGAEICTGAGVQTTVFKNYGVTLYKTGGSATTAALTQGWQVTSLWQNSLVCSPPGARAYLSLGPNYFSPVDARFIGHFVLRQGGVCSANGGKLDVITHATSFAVDCRDSYVGENSANAGFVNGLRIRAAIGSAGPAVGLFLQNSQAGYGTGGFNFEAGTDPAAVALRFQNSFGIISLRAMDGGPAISAPLSTSTALQVFNSKLTIQTGTTDVALDVGATAGAIAISEGQVVWTGAGGLSNTVSSSAPCVEATRNSYFGTTPSANRTFGGPTNGWATFFQMLEMSSAEIFNITTQNSAAPSATPHYSADKLSRINTGTCVALFDTAAGNNVTRGSMLVKTTSPTVYAVADAVPSYVI